MKLNINELETLLRLAWQMKEFAEFEQDSEKAVDLRRDAARLYGMAIAHIENGEILHDDVAQ